MTQAAIEDLVKARISELEDRDKPRLRFDKVAVRLVSTVRDALCDAVPAGTVVLFTVTAPIRVASKTATELVKKIQPLLASDSGKNDVHAVIQGNHIRVRIVDCAKASPKVLGFVHNPGPRAARTLLDVIQSTIT